MTAPSRNRRLRVTQVIFDVDAANRDAAKLLDAWPTMPGVAMGASRAGIDVTVVVSSRRRESLERDGVTYHLTDDPHRFERLLADPPDVVHVHGLNHPLHVLRLTRTLDGTPVLVQDHGSVAPRSWRRVSCRLGHRAVSGLAFTARDQALPFFETGAIPQGVPVFEVIEGSSPFVPGDRDAARQITGMFGDPCLLWTGRLNANKDPLTMLDAFEMAAYRLPAARLWCCFGAAPLREVVTRRIAASPVLRERVTLLGTVPHAAMEAHFRAADFFVQTSHREGSGYSLLEALSCGTVPLVTDIPAARRIVDDVGALTPVGDARAMADVMVQWASRDRKSMREAARARFEAALTYDAIGRELRAAYESLVAAR